jgi:putative heme degradation protein
MTLRGAWDSAQTDDDFRALLASFRLSELEALRVLGTELAYPIAMSDVRELLALSVDLDVPILFEAKDGPASEIDIYLGSANIGSAWIVRRRALHRAPCLELYDARGARVVRVAAAKGEAARMAWALLVGAHSDGST